MTAQIAEMAEAWRDERDDDRMSLDIWFREDIRHILMAAERAHASSLAQAAEATGSDLAALRAYNRGYRAALSAVALACGLRLDEEGEADARPVRRRGGLP